MTKAPHQEIKTDQDEFPCSSCGAVIGFEPGAQMLRCDYCGHENPVEHDTGARVVENDLHAQLSQKEAAHSQEDVNAVKCTSCAAQFTYGADQSAGACPFCGTAIVLEPSLLRQLSPDGVIPFAITQEQAQAAAQKWLGKLFFAPAKFKKFGRQEGAMRAIYVPFWTFDAKSDSRYHGMRGINYTVTVGSGKNRRTVVKTRWTPVSGRIKHFFDDVLVWAGRSVPENIIRRFRGWRLSALKPYSAQYLAGAEAQVYDTPLSDAHPRAQKTMRTRITQMVRQDIGGDKQRINSLSINYSDETFKLILAPLWLSALQYQGKSYTLVINGQTGEVRGDRPLSFWKIAGLVALGLLVAGAALALVVASN